MQALKISLLVFIFSITISAQWYQQNSGTTQGFYGVDFADSLNGIAVGGNGIIIRTANGGENWAIQTSGTTNDLLGISFIDEYNGIAVGIYGTILKTTDGGQNWVQQTSGTGFTFLGIQMLSENVALAIGYFGIILKTVDGGQTWIPKSSGTGKQIYSISFVDMNNGIAVGGDTDGGIIIKTTDGGETWITKLEGIPETLYGISAVDINNATAAGGYFDILFETKIILRTFDGGENWSIQLFETVSPLRGISCTDIYNGTAVGMDGVILRTTDGGLTWINQSNGITNTVLVAVSVTDVNNGWAVGWFGTVLHTNNGGTPVELISFAADYVKSENAIELTWSTATETNNSGFEILRFAQNDNDEWEKLGFVPGHGTTTETQQYSFTDSDIMPGKYQYKLKQIDYDGTFEYSQIVEVEVPFVNEFSLSQNYPNPFNPVTKIKYSIPQNVRRETGNVTLKIYDVLGREIATLVNEEKPAGEFEIEFNGSALTSGIYFYQLKAGSFSETRKMVLMK